MISIFIVIDVFFVPSQHLFRIDAVEFQGESLFRLVSSMMSRACHMRQVYLCVFICSRHFESFFILSVPYLLTVTLHRTFIILSVFLSQCQWFLFVLLQSGMGSEMIACVLLSYELILIDREPIQTSPHLPHR